MSIENLRSQIDVIDNQLVDLFKDRMQICLEIAKYKKASGLPVFDVSRERSLLHKVTERAGSDFEIYMRVFFSMLMDVSRSYQHKYLAEDSKLSETIMKAVEQTPKLFPEKAVVACQGIEGAYSQYACDKLFSLPDIMYFSSFESVINAVQNGLCRYGVLPIENSTAGSVNQIYDLLQHHNINIVRTARIQVAHSLLVNSGSTLADVKEVISHEQALAQCSNFLAGLKNVKVTVCENTAVAAQKVAESKRKDLAAISSKACAEIYGLSILGDGIQNNDGNYTRFICISKELEIYPGANRTSFMMVIPHKPGALYRVLVRFYALGMNLVKLESRPIPGRTFEFMFYFDVESPVYSPALMQLIGELESSIEDFRYLGSYSEMV
jgi:chorismate mutase / prephenate dehydratase